MELQLEPTINYQVYSNSLDISKALAELPDLIACDFEAASIYSDADREAMRRELEDQSLPQMYRLDIEAKLSSSALSHPYYVIPTHLSIATSPTDAIVIVLTNRTLIRLVMTWLTATTRKQIWHNLSYDGKLIYYWTKGKFPKDYEDTAILAKVLLNHVDTYKANNSLKHLMGYKYGSWAISSDNFTVENLHDEQLIKYAAIDACATYQLYLDMTQYMERNQ
jgi:DNA polymerase I-like protein with 3'-5' exonuclease and polymerase domains